MLYVIIIAAVVVVLFLNKKADTGGGNTGGGAGGGGASGGDTTLPADTAIYKESDGQLILYGPLSESIVVTSLPDATRPDYRYFIPANGKPPRVGH
jgi:hypothetical protein